MTDQAKVHGEPEHRYDEAAEGRAAAERVGMAMLHEIRNVLNPILSAAYLLQAHAHDEAKVRELAAKIEGFAKAEERVAAKLRQVLEACSAGPHRDADAGAQPSPVSSSSTRRNP
jgi:nitrogen-specific signal transduction histidine kinase